MNMHRSALSSYGMRGIAHAEARAAESVHNPASGTGHQSRGRQDADMDFQSHALLKSSNAPVVMNARTIFALLKSSGTPVVMNARTIFALLKSSGTPARYWRLMHMDYCRKEMVRG